MKHPPQYVRQYIFGNCYIYLLMGALLSPIHHICVVSCQFWCWNQVIHASFWPLNKMSVCFLYLDGDMILKSNKRKIIELWDALWAPSIILPWENTLLYLDDGFLLLNINSIVAETTCLFYVLRQCLFYCHKCVQYPNHRVTISSIDYISVKIWNIPNSLSTIQIKWVYWCNL